MRCGLAIFILLGVGKHTSQARAARRPRSIRKVSSIFAVLPETFAGNMRSTGEVP